MLFCISKTKSHWNVKTINISKKWQNVQFSLPTQIYVVVISHLNVQYLRSIWNFSIWQICSTLKFERYALRDTKIIFETVNKLPIFCLIPELLFQYQQFWQSIHHLTSSLLNILGNPRPLAASSFRDNSHVPSKGLLMSPIVAHRYVAHSHNDLLSLLQAAHCCFARTFFLFCAILNRLDAVSWVGVLSPRAQIPQLHGTHTAQLYEQLKMRRWNQDLLDLGYLTKQSSHTAK